MSASQDIAATDAGTMSQVSNLSMLKNATPSTFVSSNTPTTIQSNNSDRGASLSPDPAYAPRNMNSNGFINDTSLLPLARPLDPEVMLDNFQRSDYQVARTMAIQLLHGGDLSLLYRAHAHLASASRFPKPPCLLLSFVKARISYKNAQSFKEDRSRVH